MTEDFCRLKPTTEAQSAFVELIKRREPEPLDAWLTQHPGFQAQIDWHWFSFDSPAIVEVKQNESMVKVLLKHGADINARSSWWAGSFGVLDGVSAETCRFLVKRGARFDIHSAAEQGEFELVQEFLHRDATLVHSRGGDGQSPLHTASTIPIVDLLLEHGADLEIRCLDHSATAAQYSVSEPEKCRHLIQRGATPDIFLACALGDRELVELVIREEPDCLSSVIGKCCHTSPVDPRAHLHIYAWKLLGARTPLDVARNFNHMELYRELLHRVDEVQKFLAACWDANEPMARQLIDDYPDMLERLDEDQTRLLGRAAWDGKRDAVELMLQIGFDPHLKGDEESTPLDRASFHGFREIVELLLQYDESPPLQETNRFGGVPLSCCAYGATHSWKQNTDHIGTAKALIGAGAKVDPTWLPVENESMNEFFKSELAKGSKQSE